MRWFGVGLGVGLLLVIAGYAVGLFLPADYHASSSRIVDASRSEVWAALHDIQDNPISGKMARKVTALESEDNYAIWVEDIGASQITVRDINSDRYSLLTREARDSVVPLYATITVRLGDRNGQTSVHVANDTKINNGTWHVPLFRLNLFFTNALEDGIDDYLDRLEADLASHAQTDTAPKS